MEKEEMLKKIHDIDVLLNDKTHGKKLNEIKLKIFL